MAQRIVFCGHVRSHAHVPAFAHGAFVREEGRSVRPGDLQHRHSAVLLVRVRLRQFFRRVLKLTNDCRLANYWIFYMVRPFTAEGWVTFGRFAGPHFVPRRSLVRSQLYQHHQHYHAVLLQGHRRGVLPLQHGQQASRARSPSSFAFRIADALRSSKWKYVRTVSGCPPLLPSLTFFLADDGRCALQYHDRVHARRRWILHLPRGQGLDRLVDLRADHHFFTRYV